MKIQPQWTNAKARIPKVFRKAKAMIIRFFTKACDDPKNRFLRPIKGEAISFPS